MRRQDTCSFIHSYVILNGAKRSLSFKKVALGFQIGTCTDICTSDLSAEAEKEWLAEFCFVLSPHWRNTILAMSFLPKRYILYSDSLSCHGTISS